MAADAEKRARDALIVRDMDRYWAEKEAAEKYSFAQAFSDKELARAQAEVGTVEQHVQGITGKKYLKADLEFLRHLAVQNEVRVHVSDEDLQAFEAGDTQQYKRLNLVGDEAAVLATYADFSAAMDVKRKLLRAS